MDNWRFAELIMMTAINFIVPVYVLNGSLT